MFAEGEEEEKMKTNDRENVKVGTKEFGDQLRLESFLFSWSPLTKQPQVH